VPDLLRGDVLAVGDDAWGVGVDGGDGVRRLSERQEVSCQARHLT